MKIIIIGAGIAGMATGIALSKAGYNVVIYERNKSIVSSLGNNGAGMVLWPNAGFILQQFDLLSDISTISGYIKYMHRFSQFKQSLASYDLSKLSKLLAYPCYSVLRKDLCQLLLRQLSVCGVKVHYGHGLQSISNINFAHVVLRFKNGNSLEVKAPDLVIGADGRMNSITRQYITGNNSAIYQGFVNYLGILESSKALVDEMSVFDYWGVNSRFGIVPISKNKIYWAAARAEDTIKFSPSDSSDEHYYREISEHFRNWPILVNRLITALENKKIAKIYVYDHNPLSDWYKDNVLMIGDAAHAALPTSGQGASQAFEDAWHLVRCLQANKDWQQSFADFNALRFNKTSSIIQLGRSLARTLFNSHGKNLELADETTRENDSKQFIHGFAASLAQGLPL